jgi:hypothetical protein
MVLRKEDLRSFSGSLIKRLFCILDYTNDATTDEDFENISKFISGIETEIKGSLAYYSDVKFGNKMPSVLMKISGIKDVSDYNIRRKAVLDSIGIIDEIIKSLDKE